MGLILPQMVETALTSVTINWYESKGYKIPRIKNGSKLSVPHGTKISVNVLDLQLGSHTIVKVQCDCCNKPFNIVYKAYNTNIEKSNRTFCKECSLDEIQKENRHDITGIYKWGRREYALEQLDNFIKSNETLKGMTVNNTEGNRIRTSLRNNGYNIKELCEDLGYDYLNLNKQFYDDEYLNNFDNIKLEVNKFIEIYGYFPTTKNFIYDLHIPTSIITKYGNMNDLQKEIMGDKNNLLEDDRGFYNRSHYEYMVAQFLIHNNIDYLREQFPFPKPNNMLRSDFTFYGVDGQVYHVELWGYYETDVVSSRSFQYNQKRKEKEALYDKHKINLIAINPDTFNYSLEIVQNNLSIIFQKYMELTLTKIDIKYMINPNKLSDLELLDRLMEYSDDSRFLPKQEVLMKNVSSLYNEMIRRYGNQNNFAIKYDKLTYSKVGMWNNDFALKIFNYMHNEYGCLLRGSEIINCFLYRNDNMLIGFANGIRKVFGCTTDGYLFYYNYCLDKQIILHEKDISYLKDLSIGRYFNGKVATQLRKDKAKKILDTYYTMGYFEEVA